MDVTKAFIDLGVALGLGLLVGMQRERSASPIAGIRTFALITMLGAIAAMLAAPLGGWVFAAALLGLGLVSVAGGVAGRRTQKEPAGITTEVAILLMFAVGGLVVLGPRELAVTVGGVVVILLHAKATLHTLVDRLGAADLRAIMQFVLITLVILPVLPDRTFGPLDVLNPRDIWLMVVLVVGISLGGYVAYKALGGAGGILVNGLLGGMISSTAATVSAARRASDARHHVNGAAVVIMLASMVVYGRVIVEIALAAPKFAAQIIPPVAIAMGVAVVLAAATALIARREPAELPPQTNPSELKSALFFAGMYALVILAVAAAQKYLPQGGLYGVAVLSGLTDMDAITLSTSRLAEQGRVEPSVAWRAILIASISNLVFKAGIVAVLGSRALLTRVATLFAVMIAASLLLLVMWTA